jgi:hypothetical protein
MKPPVVCVSPPKEAGVVEPKLTAITRQRHGKHFPTTNKHAKIEELSDALFSVRSV